MGKTLVFAVYDFDRFSKHDAIGELRLPVCQLDLASSKDCWKDLLSIQGDGVVSFLYFYMHRILVFEYIVKNIKLINNRILHLNFNYCLSKTM